MTRRRRDPLPRVSYEVPPQKWAPLPAWAVMHPEVQRRTHLLLLLGAFAIHASAWGICYPSQRRLAAICGRSPSWVCKYVKDLYRLGLLRRLTQPRYRGARVAHRVQIVWTPGSPLPPKEALWDESPWCWRDPRPEGPRLE